MITVKNPLTQTWPKPVMALGNFDGVHLGHQAILKDTVLTARALGGTSIAFTFWPHPSRVLAPNRAPKLIQTLSQRENAISLQGIDVLIVQNFDLAFSKIEYTEFFEKVLYENLKPQAIRVGARVAFGHERRGNAANLADLCQRYGVDFKVLPEFRLHEEALSSSRIREFLSLGEVSQANRFLGRPYTVDGKVVKGENRGHALGFPTANVHMENERLLPRGVYACRVFLKGEATGIDGVANLGIRPTFATTQNPSEIDILEVHLFDFQREIYGKEISVEVFHYLRAERKFSNLAELKMQIAQDCQDAKIIFTNIYK